MEFGIKQGYNSFEETYNRSFFFGLFKCLYFIVVVDECFRLFLEKKYKISRGIRAMPVYVLI